MTNDHARPPADKPFKALVFDFDGTIANSGDTKNRAYHHAISSVLDVPNIKRQRAYERYGTLNRQPQLENAFRELASRPPQDEELRHMLSTYAATVRAEHSSVRLVDGMRDFLLRTRERAVLTIASNAPQDELEASCHALQIRDLFRAVWGYPTSKLDAIETTIQRWNLRHSQLLYIGDRREDGAIARQAGVPFRRFGPLEPDDGTPILRKVSELEAVSFFA